MNILCEFNINEIDNEQRNLLQFFIDEFKPSVLEAYTVLGSEKQKTYSFVFDKFHVEINNEILICKR